MRGDRIFHITTPAAMDELRAEGTLAPDSLADEGFVHCSTATQVVAATERHFRTGDDLLLIELDGALLHADLEWPEVYPDERFPHLHGPIPLSAVVAVHPWRPPDRASWSTGEDSD